MAGQSVELILLARDELSPVLKTAAAEAQNFQRNLSGLSGSAASVKGALTDINGASVAYGTATSQAKTESAKFYQELQKGQGPAAGAAKGVKDLTGALTPLAQLAPGISSNLTALASSMTKLQTASIAAAAVLAGGGALVKGLTDSIEQMDNLSNQTGLSVDALEALQQVAKESGASFDAIAPQLGKITQFLAEVDKGNIESVQQNFDALGISFKDLATSGQPLEKIFETIAQKITAIEDPTKRAAAQQDIFGSKSLAMSNILKQIGTDGLDPLIKKMEEAGVVTSQSARLIARALDEMADAADRQITGLKNQVAGGLSAIALEVGAFFNKLAQADQQAFKGNAGQAFSTVISAFTGIGGEIEKTLNKVAAASEQSYKQVGDAAASAVPGIESVKDATARVKTEIEGLKSATEATVKTLQALGSPISAINAGTSGQQSVLDKQFALDQKALDDAIARGITSVADGLQKRLTLEQKYHDDSIALEQDAADKRKAAIEGLTASALSSLQNLSGLGDITSKLGVAKFLQDSQNAIKTWMGVLDAIQNGDQTFQAAGLSIADVQKVIATLTQNMEQATSTGIVPATKATEDLNKQLVVTQQVAGAAASSLESLFNIGPGPTLNAIQDIVQAGQAAVNAINAANAASSGAQAPIPSGTPSASTPGAGVASAILGGNPGAAAAGGSYTPISGLQNTISTLQPGGLNSINNIASGVSAGFTQAGVASQQLATSSQGASQNIGQMSTSSQGAAQATGSLASAATAAAGSLASLATSATQQASQGGGGIKGGGGYGGAGTVTNAGAPNLNLSYGGTISGGSQSIGNPGAAAPGGSYTPTSGLQNTISILSGGGLNSIGGSGTIGQPGYVPPGSGLTPFTQLNAAYDLSQIQFGSSGGGGIYGGGGVYTPAGQDTYYGPGAGGSYSSGIQTFAKGGMVKGSPGQPVLVIAHAGETVVPASAYKDSMGNYGGPGPMALQSFAKGGVVKGSKGQAVPIIAHAGEWILPEGAPAAAMQGATVGGKVQSFASGGQVQGPPGKAVPIIAHAGEWIVPNSNPGVQAGAGGTGPIGGGGNTYVKVDPGAVQVTGTLVQAERDFDTLTELLAQRIAVRATRGAR